jgi:hypothetical protein
MGKHRLPHESGRAAPAAIARRCGMRDIRLHGIDKNRRKPHGEARTTGASFQPWRRGGMRVAAPEAWHP